MTDKHSTQRRVWGRRIGRPLKGDRLAAMEEIFPKLNIADALDGAADGALDPFVLFTQVPSSLWMEIGFGGGEHVIGELAQNSDISMLACEPFVDGMGNLMKDLPEALQPRLRVLNDDAMLLVRALRANCLDRLYILNPDPWHKARHHKRRIVNPDNLDEFARVLKPGAQLILSTDVPGLADWMITHTVNHGAFAWQARSCADWQNKPEGWVTTRYEEKKAKGADKMSYLLFTRR